MSWGSPSDCRGPRALWAWSSSIPWERISGINYMTREITAAGISVIDSGKPLILK